MTQNDFDRARDALFSIPPDCDRETWVKAAMGFQAAGGDFGTFDCWSAGAGNYNPRDTRDTWRSIKPGKGIGEGTLYRMAAENGWRMGGNKQKPMQTSKRHVEPPRKPAQRFNSAEVWSRCKPASNEHAYIMAKDAAGVPLENLRVVPEGDPLRIAGQNMAGALIVPAYGPDGLQSLQLIPPPGAGKKLNLPGAPMAGASFTVGELVTGGVAYLCEGIGTAWACWQATGHPAVVCFGWGNVARVAADLRQQDKSARLVLVPDTGKEESAFKVAADVGALVACMPKGEAQNFDANDLSKRDGFDVLADLLNSASEPDKPGTWPDPEPLPDALPPVAPFDLELLPEAFRGWVGDIAHRMQCPLDFTAVGAVVAASSLIAARAMVKPKSRDDWAVVPNLWGVVVGRPGVMKSPALGETLKPLSRLQAGEREAWQAAHDEWALDNKVAELAAKANEQQASKIAAKDPAKARALLEPTDDTTAEPTMRRYVVNDATVEALQEVLMVNPWGVLVFRDELHGLLCSMDKQGQEQARGFYLTGYDGNQGYTVDRILRGIGQHIPRVCLAMLGGIQPGKLQSYVREAVAGGASDDGLLQRFGLAVWPDVNREFVYVDQWPDTPAKQAAWAVFERLNHLQGVTDTEPQEWRFSTEAQALFVEWLEPFETEIRGDELHPALVSHLSKYRKLVPALALIFALVDTPDSGNVIHERELIRALAWVDYLRTHAERIYAAAVIPETAGAKQLLDKIKSGKLCDGDGVLLETFTPRLVAVKHWAGLGTPEAVRKAADLLADYGWLMRETVHSTDVMGRGRPSDRYLIHPKAMKGGV